MKYAGIFILLLITKMSLAQVDTSAVLSAELPEIIITSKKHNVRHHNVLNLAKYGSMHSASIRCNENLGVMIPQRVEDEIYLKNVVIPVRKGMQLKEHDRGDIEYRYYLLLAGKETRRIQVTPKSIDRTGKKIRLTIDQSFFINEPVTQFFFFLVPVCDSQRYATDDLFRFTFRFRSRLTYQLHDNKVELLDLKDRDSVTFSDDRFLNWKIKIEYSYDNK